MKTISSYFIWTIKQKTLIWKFIIGGKPLYEWLTFVIGGLEERQWMTKQNDPINPFELMIGNILLFEINTSIFTHDLYISIPFIAA